MPGDLSLSADLRRSSLIFCFELRAPSVSVPRTGSSGSRQLENLEVSAYNQFFSGSPGRTDVVGALTNPKRHSLVDVVLVKNDSDNGRNR